MGKLHKQNIQVIENLLNVGCELRLQATNQS